MCFTTELNITVAREEAPAEALFSRPFSREAGLHQGLQFLAVGGATAKSKFNVETLRAFVSGELEPVKNAGFDGVCFDIEKTQGGAEELAVAFTEAFAACKKAGLLVGDIILSVGEESEVDTNVIIERLSNVVGEVILEVAGNSPSRLCMIPNPHAAKDGTNGSLTLSDTACGVGVYVSAVEPAAELPAGAGRLDVGDIILSVDGAVTESAKETMKYIARAPDPLTFVVAGRSIVEALPTMGA